MAASCGAAEALLVLLYEKCREGGDETKLFEADFTMQVVFVMLVSSKIGFRV